MTPKEARELFRSGKLCRPTSGMCPGYAQANLIILPKEHAYDFLLFAQRNPKATSVVILPGCNHGNGMYKQTALYQSAIKDLLDQNVSA